MNIEIRKENEEDFYNAELAIQRAFYNVYMPGCDEHLLLHRMRGSIDYLPDISRIITVEGRLAGGIYCSQARLATENETTAVMTFGPLGIDPEYQKQGLGSLLVKEIIRLAGAADYPAIIITGVPDYYPRFGFKSCSSLGLYVKDHIQFPALMGYSLKKDFLETHPGQFIESDVFRLPETRAELDEYDKNFPPLPKEVRADQWKHIN